MFPSARLKYLADRKRELLAASQVQRELLVAECAAIHQRLAWVEQTIDITRRLLPFATLVPPLLGLWKARRSAQDGSWLKGMLSLVPIVQRVARTLQPLLTRKASYD